MLLYKEEIVWVVGLRLSEKFKVNPDTVRFARLTYLEEAIGGMNSSHI